MISGLLRWSGWEDSNLRPLEPHSSTLPNCATPSRGRLSSTNEWHYTTNRWICQYLFLKIYQFYKINWKLLDARTIVTYNRNAVWMCLRLKVDARRGRNDPRKPAKVRWAWRALEVSPAGQKFLPRGLVVGRQSPYERKLQQASVGSKTRSGVRAALFD